MKALYLDTFAGLSGDKIVAAILDAGLPIESLRDPVARLGLGEVELTAEKVRVGAVMATRFAVHCGGEQRERTLGVIRGMLESSALAAGVQARVLRIFDLLAQAEAKIHGVSPDQVHFHEVGAVDSIVDIVGVCLGFEALGVEQLFVGPLPLGSGVVETAHGPLPVPAPATVELLRGLPVRFQSGVGEMITPTGAAVLAGFGAQPVERVPFVIERVGYGAGTRHLEDRPNVLRAVLGEVVEGDSPAQCEVIEANIDDLNPQFYDYIGKRLLGAGALDVAMLPLLMKKGRPGTLLSVIAPPSLSEVLADIVLEETSTLGVRISEVRRRTLARRVITVRTAFGEIDVKVASRPSGKTSVHPEYEHCARAAEKASVALAEVHQAAVAAAEAALREERR